MVSIYFCHCINYGAAAFFFPETNTNWSQRHQCQKLQTHLHNSCEISTFQTSWLIEPFLSSYQPEGTTTVLCHKWATGVISKEEDPLGLGRWSFLTLRGKKGCNVTLVTAYNSRYAPGPKSSYQQQNRLLSQIFRQNSITAKPSPHRQFILDFQSWIIMN
jgi:hypothetical protein